MTGTVYGSAVANVVTTGSFTIPLMKNYGYRAKFAAAVEACASSGGQITPPIMGAAAFIIETLQGTKSEEAQAKVLKKILQHKSIREIVEKAGFIDSESKKYRTEFLLGMLFLCESMP